MSRHSRIHNFAIARLATMHVHVDRQRLEDQKELAVAAGTLTRLQLDDTPSVDARVHQESVELVFRMNQC